MMMKMNIIFYNTHPSVQIPKREVGRVMHMTYGYRSSDPFFDTFVSSLTCPGERKYFSTTPTGSKNSQQRNHVIDNIQNSLRNLQSFVPQTQIITPLHNVQTMGGRGDVGYKGYNMLYVFGSCLDLIESKDMFKVEIQKFLCLLDENATYTILGVVKYYNRDSGQTEGMTIGKSIKVNNQNDIELLWKRLRLDLLSFYMRYDVDGNDHVLVMNFRKWLDNDEFIVQKKILTNTLNNVIKDSLPIMKDISRRRENLMNSDVLLGEYKNVLMDKYGEILESEYDVEDKNVRYHKLQSNEILEVRTIQGHNDKTLQNIINDNENIDWDICRRKCQIKEVSVQRKSGQLPIFGWKDIRIDENMFIRVIGNYRIYYVDEIITRMEGLYNFPNIRCEKVELEYNGHIGSMDFETFGDKDNGYGEHTAYAGSWSLNNVTKLFWLQLNVVKVMIILYLELLIVFLTIKRIRMLQFIYII